MIKNKTDNNEYDCKLINEKYYLIDKSNDLKKRNINSANPNKLEKKNDLKKFYLLKSDNKKHNNNIFLYGKNQLTSNIKYISYQRIFNLIERYNKSSRENYFPKLFKMPKNIINNKNINGDKLLHFLKKNKTNYSIQNENNKNNNNIIYFRTIINSYNKINNSKSESYNNNINNNNINNNQNMNKTHTNKFYRSNKICTTSNCCDASTNTNYENGFLNNNLNDNHNREHNYNNSNYKKRKRPLIQSIKNFVMDSIN